MKYFIGVPIPKPYRDKIDAIRAEFRFFTTEPHITLIPPPSLPDDDTFISPLAGLLRGKDKLKVSLTGTGHFGSRVLYVSVQCPELSKLHDDIQAALGLPDEGRQYTPHLTIAKQRPGRPIKLKDFEERVKAVLPPYTEFNLSFLVVYKQPKEKSIYLPHMRIPLGE